MDSTVVLSREELPPAHSLRPGPPRTDTLEYAYRPRRRSSAASSHRSYEGHPLYPLDLYDLPPPSKPPRLMSSMSNASSIAGPGSSASSTTSLEMKRESSDDRDQRSRCDSTATGGETRLSICSTSGTVYESVVVVGHNYGSDNVVYYLLEVKSWENPLEGYVIRRRYNDFKEFHRQLALCMPQTGGVRRGPITAAPSMMGTGSTVSHRSGSTQAHRNANTSGFGLYTSSLLCNPLSTSRPETSPLWSPRRSRVDSQRRASTTGLHYYGLEERKSSYARSEPRSQQPELHHLHGEPDSRVSAPSNMGMPPWHRPLWTNSAHHVDLPFHTVSFDRDGRPLLPSMPPGGVSSFFTSREMLIKYRIEKFNRLLAAVLSDTSPRVSQLLMNFIQDKPSAPQTYVSLNQYAPVEMPWSVEWAARQNATGKKTSSQHSSQAHSYQAHG